jgi:hypothetical protein
LKTIIHHNDACSGGTCECRSGDAVARDDGGREPRQEHWFVADVGSPMQRRIDAHRAGQSTAIASTQKERTLMGGMEELGYGESRRSFAGAADREITQANNRQAGLLPWRPHSPSRHGAVKCSQRGDQSACSASPPKGGLAHQFVGSGTMAVMRVPRGEAE